MKFLICLVIIFTFLQGCILTKPDYKTEPDGTHILNSDKEQLKESIRHQKEHAKAAEKRRKELDHISHKHRSDRLEKKKKKK